MLKVAPTLIVELVEPSVRFWTEQLGFTKVTDVPGEDGLVFAMLSNGNVEVRSCKKNQVRAVALMNHSPHGRFNLVNTLK